MMYRTRHGAIAVILGLLGTGASPVLARSFYPCLGVSPVETTELKSIVVAEQLGGRVIAVTSPPGDINRLFMALKNGRVFIHARGDARADNRLFLDLSAQINDLFEEMGLLGFAFDPDYADNGHFYVSYTDSDDPERGPHWLVLSRYSVSAQDPDVADPASEEQLLVIDQPEVNHNGGHLLFGIDGYLYLATGDGGGGGDRHGPCGNAQNRESLLGKILRLDVSLNPPPENLSPDCGGPASVYTIPWDNPWVSSESGCQEVWSWGLRNPWRWSVDPITADVYIGDVGQRCWEEINYSPWDDASGANWGWREMEGNHCLDQINGTDCDNADPVPGCPTTCGDPSLRRPIYEYRHEGDRCSVIGGYVYRGCRMPALWGQYFFGDYCEGSVFSFRVVDGLATDVQDRSQEIDPDNALFYRLNSFGIDAQGELYICDGDGNVRKIMPVFTSLQVSGPGAGEPFLLGKQSWSWEDVAYATMHPVSHYKVYRGAPNELFDCIHETASTSWIDGDPERPNDGELFAYLVTAVSPDGEETSPGDPQSARQLSLAPCPSMLSLSRGGPEVASLP